MSSSKTYTQEELDKALADQLAQIKSGLLSFGAKNPLFAGPLDLQSPTASMGPIAADFFRQTGGVSPTVRPQGYGIMPGAGTFGPQGVLFAGGSPWPVSSAPAQAANIGVAANGVFDFLRQSGILDKLLGK